MANQLTESPVRQPIPQQKLQPIKQQKQFRNKYLSYGLMILSCVTWVSGFLYCNEHNIDPIQTSILRGFMIMVLSAVFCVWNGIQINLKDKNKYKLLWKRNSLFLLQAFLMAAIQFYLPLGILHTLTMTGSIFVAVNQYIFQKKVPHSRQVIAIILTFFGIALTSNGNLISKWLDSSYQFTTQFANYRSLDPAHMAFWSIVFTVFMAFWSFAVYSTGNMNVSPYSINFHFGLKLYLLSSLLYPYISYSPQKITQFVNVDPHIFYPGILLSGLLLSIAEMSFVYALVISENIGMTMMMCACNSVVGYFVSLLKYHEKLNGFCASGTALIVIGLFMIMVHS